MFYSKFDFDLKPAIKEPERLKGNALWKFVRSESSFTLFFAETCRRLNFMLLKKPQDGKKEPVCTN
jgi:hypothetical protein